MRAPSVVEMRLWERRSIDVLDLPLEAYTAGLEERLGSFDVAGVLA